MAGLRLTRAAREDLKAIGRYTERTGGRRQRDAYLTLLDRRFHLLAEIPTLGRVCDVIRPGFRRFAEGRHVIFYREGGTSRAGGGGRHAPERPGFRVRAVVLDHGTPVLAFAFEPAIQINVRKDRLTERGLVPGPWLTGLKQRILCGDYGADVWLPDGRRQTVAALASDLTLTSPGAKLVYATDFADTEGNRDRVTALAAGAQVLFCESSFLTKDRAQAERTGHLTARGCGEIAAAAGVRYLIPFHFSRRYEDAPWRVYDEVAAACPQTVIPKDQGGPRIARPADSALLDDR
jgi:ribonuclease BN (tRNA processing enzyme)